MPKLKNIFTSGKMNKDLDERLIPNGEYRHATNIDVSTSEKEGVGAVKNIKGNEILNGVLHDDLFDYYSPNSSYKPSIHTLASIADEENNKFYWLTKGESIVNQIFFKDTGGVFTLRMPTKDINDVEGWCEKNIIFEVIKTETTAPASVNYALQPIFADVYKFARIGESIAINTHHDKIIIPDGRYIEKGMLVRAIVSGVSNQNLSDIYSNTVFIKEITAQPNASHPHRVEITLSHQQISALPILVFIFEKESTLKFSSQDLITGINIVDNMIFWTDNETEPKKINVSRSKEGTPDLAVHTTNIVTNNIVLNDLMEEKHVTVIHPAPKVSPVLHAEIDGRSGVVQCQAAITNTDFVVRLNGIANMEFNGVSALPVFQVNDVILIQSQDNMATLPLPDNIIMKVKIQEILPSTASPILEAKVKIVYMSPNATTVPVDYEARLEEETVPMFERKFSRFAYRYKFEDGEYSPPSPFTNVIFEADNYSYHPKEAYNLGMKNTIKELVLKDFVSPYIPKDVVQIDLLYKEEESPNIYSIDVIKIDDPKTIRFKNPVTGLSDYYNSWTHPGTSFHSSSHTGSYKILTENIYAALPEDQTLRHFDIVPRKALAQEIVGNRLVYANYTQGYNLKDFSNNTIKPRLNTGYEPRYGEWIGDGETAVGRPSLKSLRTYKLGLAYIDKYGRQTPVFTDADSSVTVPKIEAVNANSLTATIQNQPPNWAEYYKVFVKEITSEYYNLAMDRIYEAGDSNVWISFPSAERNKIDEDTYLILKKKPDISGSEALLTEEGKYKVIAIENEAPDFIKTINKTLGTASGIGSLFANSSAGGNIIGTYPGASPGQKTIEFYIGTSSYGWISQGGESDEAKMGEMSHIQFLGDNNYRSKRYEVNKCQKNTAPDRWTVELRGDGIEDVDHEWLSGSNPAVASVTVNGNSYQMASGLTIVCFREELKNLPEFDGRFFVKIKKDQAVIDNLYTAQTSAQKFVTAAATPTYYLADKLAPKYGEGHLYQKNEFIFGTVTSATSASTAGSTIASWSSGLDDSHTTDAVQSNGVGASHRKEHWDDNLGSGSKWFIDQAFYACGQGHDVPNDRNPNSWQYGMGFGRGMYPINGGNEAIMELSFGGILADPDGDDYGKIQDPSLFVVGEASNKSHDEESRTVSRLFKGSKFRFANDPDGVIYTITNSPTGRRRINHTSLHETRYGNIVDDQVIIPFPWTITEWMRLLADPMDLVPIKHSTPAGTHVMTTPVFVSRSRYTSEFAPWHVPYWTHLDSRGDSRNNELNSFNISPFPQNGVPHPNGALHAFNEPNLINGGTDANMWAKEYLMNSPDYGWTFGDAESTDQDLDAQTINTIKGQMWASITNKNMFLSRSNRRKFWRLRIKPNPFNQSYNPIDPAKHDTLGTTMVNASNATSIIWLKADEGDESLNKQSGNPAVFETEPKKDVDLDIYHETNMQYPIYLDDAHGYDFAPAGTKVSTSITNTSGNNLLIWDAEVLSWEDTRLTLYSPNVGEQIGDFDVNDFTPHNGAEFIFTRKDGSYTMAKLDVAATFSSATLANPTVDSLVFERDVSRNRIGLSWYNCFSFNNGVESDRIRDDFNAVTIDNGPRVSTVSLKQYKEEVRKSSLIYSGLYNSKTGLNSLNEFIEGNKITKDLNPDYGSIQKLFTRNTDLVAFCEDRVLKILANKDALYNADGNPNLIASSAVLGQAQPFVGDYGISKNPESFSSESYRVYFTDKSRGAVMRLSLDGLEPISDHGMKSWFNENLKYGDKLLGSYDIKKKEYNLTILPFTEYYEELEFTWPNWQDIPIPDDSTAQA